LTGGSQWKHFAPSGHHILYKDAKVREIIKVISLLEYCQPCQGFSGDASECTCCVTDVIREYHLHLDSSKMLL